MKLFCVQVIEVTKIPTHLKVVWQLAEGYSTKSADCDNVV